MSAVRPAAGVLFVALAAWAVTLARMPDVDGALPAYVALWVTMSAAMMLPSAVPMLLVVGATGGGVKTFAVGYLAAWSAFGLAAFGAARVVGDVGAGAAGVALVAAGVYQLTPFKHSCLRRCRNPLAFLRRFRRGGSLGIGFAHGVFCVGCCAGLMVALFAVGLMSLAWSAVAAAAILAEKVVPHGARTAYASGVALVAAGTWIAL